jgi:hypothetical protein
MVFRRFVHLPVLFIEKYGYGEKQGCHLQKKISLTPEHFSKEYPNLQNTHFFLEYGHGIGIRKRHL